MKAPHIPIPHTSSSSQKVANSSWFWYVCILWGKIRTFIYVWPFKIYTKRIITYIVFCPLHLSLEMRLRDLTVPGQSPNVIGVFSCSPSLLDIRGIFLCLFLHRILLTVLGFSCILACCIVLPDHRWEKFVPSCTSHDGVFECTHFFHFQQ